MEDFEFVILIILVPAMCGPRYASFRGNKNGIEKMDYSQRCSGFDSSLGGKPLSIDKVKIAGIAN